AWLINVLGLMLYCVCSTCPKLQVGNIAVSARAAQPTNVATKSTFRISATTFVRGMNAIVKAAMQTKAIMKEFIGWATTVARLGRPIAKRKPGRNTLPTSHALRAVHANAKKVMKVLTISPNDGCSDRLTQT